MGLGDTVHDREAQASAAVVSMGLSVRIEDLG
jgi:hypothetical protein